MPDLYRGKVALAARESADSKGLAMLKYDPALAKQAWERTMGFFGKHLR